MERAVYKRMEEIDGHHWWFVARRRIVATLIGRRVAPGRELRILEIGCGTGSNIAMLRDFGAVDAVEPDAEARAVAAARTGAAVQGGYLPDQVEIEDGAYDLIVMLDVLEHIPDDVAALTALKSKLADGGRILLTVPAMPWLWSAHDVAHHHQRRYTGTRLKTALGAAGFQTRHQTHFNSLLLPLIILARLAGKIAGREGGDDSMPPTLLNRVLMGVFGAERLWIGRLAIPFGVSLAVVAEPA